MYLIGDRITHDEEKFLVANLHVKKHRDRLVLAHLRQVNGIANNYRKTNLPIEEIQAAGMLGLMMAVEKFDPSKGLRLSTYATHYIKAEINSYCERFKTVFRVVPDASYKKMFYKAGDAIRDPAFQSASDKLQFVADKLDIPVRVVIDYMSRVKPIVDLDSTLPSGQQVKDTISDGIDHEEDIIERMDKKNKLLSLRNAMSALDQKEYDILCERFSFGTDRSIIGKKYGVSRETIRKWENRAIDKLREGMLG